MAAALSPAAADALLAVVGRSEPSGPPACRDCGQPFDAVDELDRVVREVMRFAADLPPDQARALCSLLGQT